MKTDRFLVILIKPSRYDDDGYVIQWRRAIYSSLALATLNALAEDCAARRTLGPAVEIVVEGYEDQSGLPPVDALIRRIKKASAGALVCIVDALTTQFPRGADLARRFRTAGAQVVIGGFHVSGAIAVIPEPTAELQAMRDIGVSLFAGEAEGRFEALLGDAYVGSMKPIYNYLDDPVDLTRAPPPTRLPAGVEKGLALALDPIDPIEASRGCPFNCSFCIVINVHGRKSRARTGNTIADLVRRKVQSGRTRFFFTDDNLSQNKNRREILEALARLREEEGLKCSLMIPVDAQSDRDPDFIPLAVRAGVEQIFVGLESVNPDALALVGKKQNVVDRYRRFFLEWKKHGVVTGAGYIIGFPGDTPDSVRRDIASIQERFHVDLLYPFILTPLPGSVDHLNMLRQGTPLDPDLSRYNSSHAVAPHPNMRREELEALWRETWRTFYSRDHTLRILRRHVALGGSLEALVPFLWAARGAIEIEGLHPFELGLLRVKRRTERRPDRPREAAVPFYLRRGAECVWSQMRWAWEFLRVQGMARAAQKREEK